MGVVKAESTQIVPASPETVYDALADYTTVRPAILPAAYSDYAVVEGGTGAGTVVTYRLSAAGRQRDYRMQVVNAEAGHRLVEQDQQSSLSTTWALAPVGGGTRVTVTTTWQGAGGIGGFFEGIFAPLGVRRLQGETLRNLAARFA